MTQSQGVLSSAPHRASIDLRDAIGHRAYYFEKARSKSYGLLRRLTRHHWKAHALLKPFVFGKCGMELGGPSATFRKEGPLPVYDLCRSMDVCNFSDNTIWDI